MITRRNILIFHSGALGDFVLAWPLMLGVGRVMPQHRTIVITAGEKGKLAERVLRVGSSDAESGWQKLFGDGDLPEKPAKLLAGARLVSLGHWSAEACVRPPRERGSYTHKGYEHDHAPTS